VNSGWKDLWKITLASLQEDTGKWVVEGAGSELMSVDIGIELPYGGFLAFLCINLRQTNMYILYGAQVSFPALQI